MDIFISHSHRDKELAERVKTFIEGTGAKAHLYTYEIDPTKTIIEKIKDGIRWCDLGIVLWTKNSRGSEWILQEIGALAITDKPIVILVQEGVKPPAGMARNLHYIRLNDPQGLQAFKEWLEGEIRTQKLIKNALIIGGIIALFYFLGSS